MSLYRVLFGGEGFLIAEPRKIIVALLGFPAGFSPSFSTLFPSKNRPEKTTRKNCPLKVPTGVLIELKPPTAIGESTFAGITYLNQQL
jgi:hypothetical protein